MYNLINGFLAYSRIQLQRGKSSRIVEIGNVLEEVLRNLSIQIKKKNAALTLKEYAHCVCRQEPDGSAFPESYLKRHEIQSLASPEIDGFLRTAENEHYRFSVKDKGLGIDAAISTKGSSRYSRDFSKVEEYEGTGIGLSSLQDG